MNHNDLNASTISSNKKQSFVESDSRPFPKSVFTESESKSSHGKLIKNEIIEISENEFDILENSQDDKVVMINNKKISMMPPLSEPE